jgi:hypothetical protein
MPLLKANLALLPATAMPTAQARTLTLQAGQVNIAGYARLDKDLVIVPVLSDNTPISKDSIQRSLNRTYGQAAVNWDVTYR